ncbi:hypothetical protein [Kitasatospora viridis]|uniref:Uncharacterized protein n=1 Tax=Kitasatospora viridis TaxID=281105 RepID=A0A561SAJ7_9ACTN|nr:hypothetical protein [Kitasatospora viridis]TWF71825.1 hypothetical protein FHX73_1722 [Kitasatospora viridis]
MAATGATWARAVRVLLVGLVLAAVCAGCGWVIYTDNFKGVKEWDVDAQGPVIVSVDGRYLTLTGVPDPAWDPGECAGNLTVTVVAVEHATTVAIHFHLRTAPADMGLPRGSCAAFAGVRGDIAHPLGSRTLTDSHGQPLKTVLVASLPRPHDPGLTEGYTGVCTPAEQPIVQGTCLGSLTVVRNYLDASQQEWTLYQSLDPTAPDPSTVADPTAQHTVLNGVPAVCGQTAEGGAVVGWTEAGTAQQLVFAPQSRATTTPDQACTRAIAEARTVR